MTPRHLLLIAVTMVSACTPEPARVNYDVLIVNGTIYDGSLAEPRVVSIGIVDDRIASMDASADAAANTVIDATGLTIVPGFIGAGQRESQLPCAGRDDRIHW